MARGLSDDECRTFLNWAAGRLRIEPYGFRRVRNQVRKRIARRMDELGIVEISRYQERLSSDADEWNQLDGMCRVTISRFYRDRWLFDRLRAVMPELVAAAGVQRRPVLRFWSAGCASGEEPYTLALLWVQDIAPSHRSVSLELTATDATAAMIERAKAAVYPRGILRELPGELRGFFAEDGGLVRLSPGVRDLVLFAPADLRSTTPSGPFDIIGCRNVAFTYFEPELQREVAGRLHKLLVDGGILLLGKGETLPEGVTGFASDPVVGEILRKVP